ncbi:MAG: radical SAM protein [bacterium]|nr:radical SAM protein [bacterium]
MHFSPLAPKSFIDTKDFRNDVKKMSEIAGNEVKEVHILGGEPLLHPELIKLLKTARYYFPNADVMLISNGILVLKQKPEFWRTLQKYQIHLSVTEYPLDINYQQITRLTQKFGVKYSFYAPSKENSQWHLPLDLKGEQDADYSFANCSKNNNCTNINIYRGKLYVCPVIAYVKYFNNFFNKNLEVTEDDYLTVKNIKDIDEIKDYISSSKPFCKYCNIDSRTFDNKWEVSCKDIQEWV